MIVEPASGAYHDHAPEFSKAGSCFAYLGLPAASKGSGMPPHELIIIPPLTYTAG